MPFLQSSGAISINDLKNFFPGLGDGNSLSNYYRGGGRLPSAKLVRDPTSGFYTNASFSWAWYAGGTGLVLRWNGVNVFNGGVGSGGQNLTSYTTGGFTYLRGAVTQDNTGYGGTGFMYYQIARENTVSINTSIPQSGTISLFQFYGAEKP